MYRLVICKLHEKVKRRTCGNFQSAFVMAAYWRGEGYVVTILPRLR
jgi:hypothetical protein